MSKAITAYPLTWPAGWKRTPPAQRKRAIFSRGDYQASSTPGGQGWTQKRSLTVSDGTQRVFQEMGRLGVARGNVIVSTNVQVRLDGLPYSNRSEPTDPGVAVYWKLKGKQQCMAIDRYDRVADNLAAIAASIYAMRAIERHGGAEILERAFLGFQALPPPVSGGRPWYEVLEFPDPAIVNRADIEPRYRYLAKKLHPDNGGDPAKMAELNEAIRQAREALK